MEKHRSSKFTFNLNASKELLEQLSQPDEEYFETKLNHSKSKSKYVNIEDMKDETRKLFIKLEEKSYMENAEFKKEISKQIKEMTDTIRNYQNYAADLKNDIDKLNIRKTGSLGDAIEKVSRLEDEVQTLRHKHNNNEKRVSEFVDKFEKIVDENLHLTGLVGEYNKFKDLKSILEYLLNSYQGSVVSKEKSSLEYNIFKEKLEGKLNTLINKFELQEKSIKSQIYSRIEVVESSLRGSIDQTLEKINEVKIENTKAAIRLISTSESLEKEIKISCLQRSELEKLLVNLVSDFDKKSIELTETFKKSIKEMECMIQDQRCTGNELHDKTSKTNSELRIRQEKIESYIGSIEQRLQELKLSSVTKPYSIFFSSVNLTPEGFSLYIPKKNDEDFENFEDNSEEFESSVKKTNKKVLFNVSSINFNNDNKLLYQTELEEIRKRVLLQSNSANGPETDVLPNINLSAKSNGNFSKSINKLDIPLGNVEHSNNIGLLSNFDNFKEKVIENFQRSEYLIQQSRIQLVELANKVNKLLNDKNSSKYPGDFSNNRKLKASGYSSRMINTDYHFNSSNQGILSSDETEIRRDSKILSKSTNELALVKDNNHSFNTKMKESKSTYKGNSIPCKTESNLNFTNSHIKKKLNISSGGGVKYRIQPDFNTIGNKMRELEQDEYLIDNNYSIKYMDPNTCNIPKVKIAKNLAKPKDISGYMRFNIIDLKK